MGWRHHTTPPVPNPCPTVRPTYNRLEREEYVLMLRCSHWNEINNSIPCPIHLTDAQLEAHAREAEEWNETADFWDSLEGLVHRDGWTSNENYEQVFELFAQLREQGLANLSGEERIAFEKQTRWASRKDQ